MLVGICSRGFYDQIKRESNPLDKLVTINDVSFNSLKLALGLENISDTDNPLIFLDVDKKTNHIISVFIPCPGGRDRRQKQWYDDYVDSFCFIQKHIYNKHMGKPSRRTIYSLRGNQRGEMTGYLPFVKITAGVFFAKVNNLSQFNIPRGELYQQVERIWTNILKTTGLEIVFADIRLTLNDI